MAIIKQTRAADLTRDAIVLDLGDLQRQAAAIVSGARAEADRIAARAREEHARIVAGAAEEGRIKGYEAGLATGRAAGSEQGRAAALAEHKERLATLEKSWTETLNEFQSRRDELLLAAQTDVLRLALNIAERVTKRVVAADPQVAAAQLEAVLAIIVRPTRLRVRINPADRPVVESALPGLAARMGDKHHVELVDDPRLERGSCSASARDAIGADADGMGGEIDASIVTQLDRIVEALLPDADGHKQSGEGAA